MPDVDPVTNKISLQNFEGRFFPLLEECGEAQLFILTNGDFKEEDQLFSNDTQYTARYVFS